MRALIRLYPKIWRERHGDELLALLDDRRPGRSDTTPTLGDVEAR